MLLVLCGSEAWPLLLGEEHRARVFKSKVLRRIFEPKTEYIAGGWRKLHNGELHKLPSSPKVITVIKQDEGNRRGI
jgi:hypothetical protein